MIPVFKLTNYMVHNLNNLEFIITGLYPQSAQDDKGEMKIGYVPACMITLDPHAAKNMLILLGEQVRRYEAQYGDITTPLMVDKKPALSS